MIRHVVMWNVRGATRDEKLANIEQLKASFLGLRGRIPGLLHLDIGVDSSGVDYACDVVLVSDFSSQVALDAYATHPEHLRVKQELGAMRTQRHQVDYIVSE
ncbi:MAG: Dabb family protein [Burkholderiales bacterium]